MPVFRFEAMNSQGQTIKNEVDAVSEEEAIQKIRAQKLFPTSVKPKLGRRGLQTGPGGRRKKSFAIGNVSSKQLTLFTRQLSTLQDAGLPIVRSLKILEGQLKPGVLKNTLITVTDDVEGGMTFSEALAKHPKAFDKLYTNMVRAGEVGGVLDEILQRLADFREKARRLKKQIVGAMVYPIAVITVAGGILYGIMTFIVPKFKAIFVELDVTLPQMTLMLIAFSDFMRTSWYWIPAGIIAFILLIKGVGATTVGRYILDKIKLRIPLFGNILNKAVIARFTRTLGTLVASGVPILEALNITKDTAGNAVISRAIGHVHDSIREGESIAEPLAQSKICDDMVVNMVDVGEETGDLDKMLLKIADQYDEDVDLAVAGLAHLIEPIMIVILGTCVGFIVISLFLPLIKLMNSLGGS
jgi:type IV pilus assembly protein PilC